MHVICVGPCTRKYVQYNLYSTTNRTVQMRFVCFVPISPSLEVVYVQVRRQPESPHLYVQGKSFWFFISFWLGCHLPFGTLASKHKQVRVLKTVLGWLCKWCVLLFFVLFRTNCSHPHKCLLVDDTADGFRKKLHNCSRRHPFLLWWSPYFSFFLPLDLHFQCLPICFWLDIYSTVPIDNMQAGISETALFILCFFLPNIDYNFNGSGWLTDWCFTTSIFSLFRSLFFAFLLQQSKK